MNILGHQHKHSLIGNLNFFKQNVKIGNPAFLSVIIALVMFITPALYYAGWRLQVGITTISEWSQETKGTMINDIGHIKVAGP